MSIEQWQESEGVEKAPAESDRLEQPGSRLTWTIEVPTVKTLGGSVKTYVRVHPEGGGALLGSLAQAVEGLPDPHGISFEEWRKWAARHATRRFLIGYPSTLARSELLDVVEALSQEYSRAPVRNFEALAAAAQAFSRLYEGADFAALPSPSSGLAIGSASLTEGVERFEGTSDQDEVSSQRQDVMASDSPAQPVDLASSAEVAAPSNGDPNPDLPQQILDALERSKGDFKTVGSIARKLGVDRETVERELHKLGDQVRRPVGQERRYHDWWRLTKRGLTRQEKRARFKAVVTFSPMDDNF